MLPSRPSSFVYTPASLSELDKLELLINSLSSSIASSLRPRCSLDDFVMLLPISKSVLLSRALRFLFPMSVSNLWLLCTGGFFRNFFFLAMLLRRPLGPGIGPPLFPKPTAEMGLAIILEIGRGGTRLLSTGSTSILFSFLFLLVPVRRGEKFSLTESDSKFC